VGPQEASEGSPSENVDSGHNNRKQLRGGRKREKKRKERKRQEKKGKDKKRKDTNPLRVPTHRKDLSCYEVAALCYSNLVTRVRRFTGRWLQLVHCAYLLSQVQVFQMGQEVIS